MHVVVVGGSGQLGQSLLARSPEGWRISALSSTQLDVRAASVAEQLVALQPDAIVNAAAYTAVDAAEHDAAAAFAVNHEGAQKVALAAKSLGCRLIYVSTDYVFDGQKMAAYEETDAPAPLNVYGRSKLAGEQATLGAHPEALILRTSWLFSEYPPNFVQTLFHKTRSQSEVEVVHDQIGRPTYAGDVATAIYTLLAMPSMPNGPLHYGGNRAISWFGLAQAVQKIVAQYQPDAPQALLKPVLSSHYPDSAPRPHYAVLNTAKSQALGLPPSDWLTQMVHTLDQHY
ncbi:MAG: dTDP-4-dehydrorhamnose reductase [Neisseriaceae bacterium]|nr:dTDP-4-dehydrorhamnose reductase [Neisseriaceae bacterium]MBP6863439.1 dTDP-4-dehydrorhamnose reductase [Neisseriaceae bacterium]